MQVGAMRGGTAETGAGGADYRGAAEGAACTNEHSTWLAAQPQAQQMEGAQCRAEEQVEMAIEIRSRCGVRQASRGVGWIRGSPGEVQELFRVRRRRAVSAAHAGWRLGRPRGDLHRGRGRGMCKQQPTLFPC